MYTWSNHPCVRSKKCSGTESHPCYYCGVPIRLTSSDYCPDCEFAVCTSCGGCMCNREENVKMALQLLRNKYCCTRGWFERGVDHRREASLIELVPFFPSALDYCRMAEGVISTASFNPKSGVSRITKARGRR